MSVARVYIGRLSNYARDRDVERFFKGFGRIREVMVKNGYCFVVGVYLVFFFTRVPSPKQKTVTASIYERNWFRWQSSGLLLVVCL